MAATSSVGQRQRRATPVGLDRLQPSRVPESAAQSRLSPLQISFKDLQQPTEQASEPTIFPLNRREHQTSAPAAQGRSPRPGHLWTSASPSGCFPSPYLGATENPLMASIRFGTSEPQENSLHELTVAVTVPAEGIFALPSLGGGVGDRCRPRRAGRSDRLNARSPPPPTASARSSAAETPYRSRWQSGG